MKRTRPVPEPVVLGRDGLLHFQQQLGVAPHLVDGADLRADALVGGVGKRAALPRSALDQHVVPTLDELTRAGWGQRDPILVGLDLLGDADSHREPGNLTFSILDTFSLHTRAIFVDRLKPEGGPRPAPMGCPEGSGPGQALDQGTLLRAEPRWLARRGVLADVVGIAGGGDDDVDPLVGQRPFDERLRPRRDPELA